MASQRVTLTEDLVEHKRENLQKFIEKGANFSSENEQDEARNIYIQRLKDEKELKGILKEEFKIPPREVTKGLKFDYNVFKKTNEGNVLKQSILKQFFKASTAESAAWDYNTLQRSKDILDSLKKKEDKDTTKNKNGKATRPCAQERFGETSAMLNKELQKTVIQVTQEKRKDEQMDTSEASGPSVSQSQDVVLKIENIHEHLMRAHFHGRHPGYDHGFPHPEGPQSDDEKDEDDSKNKILQLLWTHQEFFDPKALSKAQAEYNYYLQIEKQWRRTLRRVKMEDIKYQKFETKLFTDFPRNRPLFAVIKTLLTQKDKKMVDAANAAAGDYYKLTVLEQTMFAEGIITNIPQGIEMDDASYSELCNEMKSRFKGKNLHLKEASEFKMVTLWEYLKLKETITSQRNQIEDLASRLSGIASQQLADGDPGFTDLGDKNRPQKLGERFAELFDETWSSAYEVLKPKNQDADDDESDEPTMDKLQQVVKVIYEYCKKVSDEQIGQIVKAMIPPVLDPVTIDAEKHKNATEQMRAKTEQMAREYRKVVAATTVKVLQKEIMEKEIKDKLLKEPFGKELQTYVDECIDLIWYMCIQQPQMEIMWAKEGDKFNREHFRFSGRKGKKYKLTVWPAVFLHKDGPLVAPGYAVPSK